MQWPVWADSDEQPPRRARAAPELLLRVRDRNAEQEQQEVTCSDAGVAATARMTVSYAEPAAVESAEGARAHSGVVDPPGGTSCDASADHPDTRDSAMMHDGIFSHEDPFNDDDSDLDCVGSLSGRFFQLVQDGVAQYEERA